MHFIGRKLYVAISPGQTLGIAKIDPHAKGFDLPETGRGRVLLSDLLLIGDRVVEKPLGPPVGADDFDDIDALLSIHELWMPRPGLDTGSPGHVFVGRRLTVRRNADVTISIDVLGRSPSPDLVPGRDTAGLVYDLEIADDGSVSEIERGRPELCPYGLTGSEIAQAAGHWTPVMSDDAVIERHAELVDRKFSAGLNDLEEVELPHFAERVDEILEPFDLATLSRLVDMTPPPPRV